jgi:hypothetical protein
MIEDGTKFLGVDSSVPTPENRSSQANGLSSMVTIEQIAEKVEAINGGSSGYTETIVDISSEQILAMGTTPIELLPELPSNQYYQYYGFIEYTFNSIEYNLASDIYVLYGDGGGLGINIGNLFLEDSNRVFYFSTDKMGTNILNLTLEEAVNNYSRMTQILTFSTYRGDNPVNGDGTLRVKIYHKTITFGA